MLGVLCTNGCILQLAAGHELHGLGQLSDGCDGLDARAD